MPTETPDALSHARAVVARLAEPLPVRPYDPNSPLYQPLPDHDYAARVLRVLADPATVEEALEAYQRVMFAHALVVNVTGEAMTSKEAKLAEAIFKGRQKAAMTAAINHILALAGRDAG